MPDAARIVKEKIGKWLPDAHSGNYGGRNKTEAHQHPVVGATTIKMNDEGLQDIYREVGDQQILYA